MCHVLKIILCKSCVMYFWLHKKCFFFRSHELNPKWFIAFLICVKTNLKTIVQYFTKIPLFFSYLAITFSIRDWKPSFGYVSCDKNSRLSQINKYLKGGGPRNRFWLIYHPKLNVLWYISLDKKAKRQGRIEISLITFSFLLKGIYLVQRRTYESTAFSFDIWAETFGRWSTNDL